MFTLTRTTADATIVTNPARPDDQLLLQDIADVLRLRATLDTLLANLLDLPTAPSATSELTATNNLAPNKLPAADDTIISAVAARALAHRHGIDLYPSTLRMALIRGSIPGAHKRGGRWFMPEAAFRIWLNAFATKT